MATKKSTAQEPAKEVNGQVIDRKMVQKVMSLRKKGLKWSEIMEQLGVGTSFVHAVRPLMKEINPDSVLPLGPGSPKYGKSKAKSKS